MKKVLLIIFITGFVFLRCGFGEEGEDGFYVTVESNAILKGAVETSGNIYGEIYFDEKDVPDITSTDLEVGYTVVCVCVLLCSGQETTAIISIEGAARSVTTSGVGGQIMFCYDGGEDGDWAYTYPLCSTFKC